MKVSSLYVKLSRYCVKVSYFKVKLSHNFVKVNIFTKKKIDKKIFYYIANFYTQAGMKVQCC